MALGKKGAHGVACPNSRSMRAALWQFRWDHTFLSLATAARWNSLVPTEEVLEGARWGTLDRGAGQGRRPQWYLGSHPIP